MTSETGRFQTNARICLSISDYHPESWNPVWPVRSIIIGLISFFVTNDQTVGSIRGATIQQQKEIALNSKTKILQNKKFNELFSTYKFNIGLGSESDNPEPV